MFLHLSVILSTRGRGCLADTPSGQTPPPSRADTPRQTATAADGTHPTGMHSCYETLPGQTPPVRRLLQRTVRILLECIPVMKKSMSVTMPNRN